jgi:hypothetical protein
LSCGALAVVEALVAVRLHQCFHLHPVVSVAVVAVAVEKLLDCF